MSSAEFSSRSGDLIRERLSSTFRQEELYMDPEDIEIVRDDETDQVRVEVHYEKTLSLWWIPIEVSFALDEKFTRLGL